MTDKELVDRYWGFFVYYKISSEDELRPDCKARENLEQIKREMIRRFICNTQNDGEVMTDDE